MTDDAPARADYLRMVDLPEGEWVAAGSFERPFLYRAGELVAAIVRHPTLPGWAFLVYRLELSIPFAGGRPLTDEIQGIAWPRHGSSAKRSYPTIDYAKRIAVEALGEVRLFDEG